MYIQKNCSDKSLVGLKIWTNWGVDPTIFKITLLETVFSKMDPNLIFLQKKSHYIILRILL